MNSTTHVHTATLWLLQGWDNTRKMWLAYGDWSSCYEYQLGRMLGHIHVYANNPPMQTRLISNEGDIIPVELFCG